MHWFSPCKKTAAFALLFFVSGVYSIPSLAQEPDPPVDEQPLGVTPSGTEVLNSASVPIIKLIASSDFLPEVLDDSVIFYVDELLEVSVELQSAETLQAQAGQTDFVYEFQVCNDGNGRERYQLETTLGGDFTPANVRIFLNDGNVPGFQGDETLYVAGEGVLLSRADERGDCVGVLVVVDVPPGTPETALATISLTAISDTVLEAGNRGERPGLGINEQGSDETGRDPNLDAADDNNTSARVDAVIGRDQADETDTGRLLVSNIALSVLKESEVINSDGSEDVRSGSVIRYTMTVSTTGIGTAENAILRDVIPDFTQFLPGSIRLNGEVKTDTQADLDGADFNGSNMNAVTVELGDVRPIDSPPVVQFSVTVN